MEVNEGLMEKESEYRNLWRGNKIIWVERKLLQCTQFDTMKTENVN